MSRGLPVALLALSAVVADAADAGSAVTPVQKVIELMEGMLAQGQNERRDEQVQFAAYKQFCDGTAVEKRDAIVLATERIEVASADTEKYAATGQRLAREIAAHDGDVAAWTKERRAAAEVRAKEEADYDALHADYSESIDALERAVDALGSQAHDRKQADASLAQVTGLGLVPERTRRMVDEFLQDEPASASGLAVEVPEAAGYETRSRGVLEMLGQLRDKFVAERTELEKKEMNARHAHEMLAAGLSTQIEQASSARDQKQAARSKALESKATAEGDLQETSAARSADKAYLEDLLTTCQQKTEDFESRQALRAEELQAITKAIEIISGSQVKGSAQTHLPSFVQARRAAALAAVFMARSPTSSAAEAAQFLQRRSRELSSPVLLDLAGRLSLSDPFAKVKKMIKDLMVRLLEEANSEATHKGWCDKELATNAHTRKEKSEAVAMLQSEIDELGASVAQLTEDIADLAKQVAEMDEAVAVATQLREAEKANNTKTIEDVVAAQAAIAQAITVLRDFYAKAATATSLVQRDQPQAPPIFDAPYRGMGGKSEGVIGMLEVIASDFAQLESATKAAEVTDQREYDRFVDDTRVDKASKSKDIEHKTAEKQHNSQALVTKKADMENTEKELDAALRYFDKLKPSCVDAGVSAADRVARRKEEIESLQEALRILGGESLP